MLTFEQDKGTYSNVGEPTEAALKVLAEKLPCPDLELAKSLPSLGPAERANAGGMSNHAFLDGTKGMENVGLNIEVGSKGEGIEGWATEVKKR